MFVEPQSPSAGGPPDRLGSGDEFDALSLGEIERRIGRLAADINAATCRWLLLVAEFDRRAGHERFGFVSCASWLAWRCSLTGRAAREQLRVARCLSGLPRIRAAFETGRLSYSKVRALTRVAEVSMEAELLELAEHASAAQLERIVRGYRRATTNDAVLAQERRHLSTRWEEDGTLSVRGSLPGEEGALLLKALEIAHAELREEDLADAAADGRERSSIPRRTNADALLALAESAIASGVRPAAGGDRHQVVVHVDVAAQEANPGDAGGTLADGVTIAPETTRRLACDASVVTLVERAGEPVSVGRKTRTVPPSLRRALRSRDGGCRFPGCERDRYVDAHHIEHWARGGETSLDNLVELCRHHHRLVHEGGFSVELRGAELVFRRPGGRIIEATPRLPAAQALAGSRDGAADPFPLSAGESMDLDLAVWGLACRWERAGSGSNEAIRFSDSLPP
jgi:hypothetical protein